MKRIALTMMMLTAAWRLFAQQPPGEQFNLADGTLYRGTGSSSLNYAVENGALVMFGKASGVTPGGGGGYIITSAKGNLEFSGYKTLIVKVSGISEADRFNMRKLLKLELNGRAQQTVTETMRNRNDPDYINARNVEAKFEISKMRNIKSINLVFFDCEREAVKIEVFYRRGK
jgi:hypothetical protein